MSKLKWKRIKGYRHYKISTNGDVYNVKRDHMLKGWTNVSGVKYVSLSKNGETKTLELAKLVLDTFKPSQTEIKVCAWHKDLELENCANNNLERCTRGDRKRMFNEMKKKKRGVYYFSHGKKNYRAILKNRQGKTVTIGYYKTEFFARFMYIRAYKKEFGRLPY